MQSRCCRTCQWYVRANGGQGACSNPQIVTEVGFSPAVRDLELRCRKGWNNDLWEASAEDVVLDIRSMLPDGGAGSGTGPSAIAEVATGSEIRESSVYDGNDRLISLSMIAEPREM